MRPLLFVMFCLACLFGSTFLIGRATGVLTVENVRWLLQLVYEIEAGYVVAAVILLLFADIFIAVPTLTITLLSGYFLGFGLGSLAAFIGVSAAAFTGYGLCRKWGERGIALIVRDEDQRRDLANTFHQSGPVMIVLSRAAPMLPEITACMAGFTKMAPHRYSLFFALSSLPYVLIAAYAGSISSIEDPKPAIYAALGLYAVLWTGWFLFRRRRKAQAAAESQPSKLGNHQSASLTISDQR